MQEYPKVSKEKFRFVDAGERAAAAESSHKPVGFFRDAWRRFRKSKASVAAAVIIGLIVAFSLVTPLAVTTHDASFLCGTYAKKPGRIAALAEYGFLDGGVRQNMNEAAYIKHLAMGAAAEESLRLSEESRYQPVIKLKKAYDQELPNKKTVRYYDARVDTYLAVGFVYRSVEQAEYRKILQWQEETGLQVLYPLIENNQYNPDFEDANNWYKMGRNGLPVSVQPDGRETLLSYSEELVLEDNYLRDAQGEPVYAQYTGGGSYETAQMKIRVLYYNYYQYLYGFAPNYLMGTDSQGYDLALRIAGGIRLSLLVAVSVSLINFIIGAAYGAAAGYYGGWVDILLCRVTDVLSGVPFIVVATLFQIHLAKELGAIPSLLFAYVLTGWLGTAGRVRTQFYRYKNQEYVMAARTLGARDRRLIWKHIFPNTLGTIITSSALVIPGVILSESMLSFLGILKLGSAEQTSLGTLLSDASGIWTNYPHLMLYPALVISLLMVCFNLFGNGLRDAFNPALRGTEG